MLCDSSHLDIWSCGLVGKMLHRVSENLRSYYCGYLWLCRPCHSSRQLCIESAYKMLAFAVLEHWLLRQKQAASVAHPAYLLASCILCFYNFFLYLFNDYLETNYLTSYLTSLCQTFRMQIMDLIFIFQLLKGHNGNQFGGIIEPTMQ